jgi:carbonic anhydrase/acetyltransferase-like protein (isoleucine patch superfamily)
MTIYRLDEYTPQLSDNGRYWIAPSADVIGRVHLEANVSIWFNAVLRGDDEAISIGPGSNVQDGAVIHADPGFPTLLGAFVSVGHRAILHGCSIADTTLIGMGAIVMNGARIGQNSIVGAGAVIPEGKEFPDNVLLIGAPARVARTLDDSVATELRAAANLYIAKWQRYAAGLVETN